MPRKVKSPAETGLSRRERQIMDILYSMGRAIGPEIQERMPDQPSYSAVRTILRVLERKGYIRHIEEGPRYIFLPVMARETARQSAMQRLIATFFDGSAKAAAVAFLGNSSEKLTEADLHEIAQAIEKAREEQNV